MEQTEQIDLPEKLDTIQVDPINPPENNDSNFFLLSLSNKQKKKKRYRN